MSYIFRSKFVHLAFLGLFTILLFAGWNKYNSQKLAEQARLAEAAAIEAAMLAKKSISKVNTEQLRCLATNIYHEAAGEPFLGQVAVARVVMNRVKHGFGSNPCRVIYQSKDVPATEDPEELKRICQFSWVCQNKGQPPRNERYMQAESIARQVLLENKWREIVPDNILFFHNTAVDPGWGYKQVLTIGNHIFYSKK